MKRMSDAELTEHHEWMECNGGPVLPLDLHEGGVTLTIIREEIAKAAATAGAVQVRRVPPPWVRRLLAPWLHFPKPGPTE